MRRRARSTAISAAVGISAVAVAASGSSFTFDANPPSSVATVPTVVAAPPSPDVVLLSVQSDQTDTVYAPPQPPSLENSVNPGGVNVDLFFRYLTDEVYRGVSHNRAADGTGARAANFQAGTQLSFNLGKLPHPYVGVFTNVNDSDPISRFQEIRPFFGIEYTLRPLIFNTGYNAYIYPERERLKPSPNTAEVFLKITLDDSYFFLTDHPILSPYIYAAYDYQRNDGVYLEAGLKHDFFLDDLGVIITPHADVAYISNFAQQFITISPQDSGFQHYDIGLTTTYSLNNLLSIPPRYGQFGVQGYFTYTSRISKNILANDELWGGVGFTFRY